MIDVVYVVKRTSDNEELKYSLRSLVNLPHRNVFIVGYKPIWAINVIHIEVNRYDFKWAKHSIRYHDAEIKWVSACQDKRLSENFYAFNDDFFCMAPIKKLPNYTKGMLNKYEDRHVSFDQHVKAIKETGQYLKTFGIYNPKDFELHLPMIMNKRKRLAVNELMRPVMKRGHSIMPRSMYGNIYDLPHVMRSDVKNPASYDGLDFLSSDDNTFRKALGDYVKAKFNRPSKYEIDVDNV